MANLTIPDEYQHGVLKLLALDARDVATLERVLSTEADDIPTRELARVAALSMDAIPEKDVYAILRSLRALYVVRSHSEVPLEEFASDLANALEDIEERQLPPEQVERFKKNVVALMAIDPFATQVKGRALQSEDERTFCRARILTDMRPVFGEDIDEGFKGMVIMHHLRLGFHATGSNHSDFYVSMDSRDLEVLKAAIERAEAKARSLRESFSNVRYLGL